MLEKTAVGGALQNAARLREHLDFPKVSLTTFEACRASFVGCEVAERAMKSREVK